MWVLWKTAKAHNIEGFWRSLSHVCVFPVPVDSMHTTSLSESWQHHKSIQYQLHWYSTQVHSLFPWLATTQSHSSARIQFWKLVELGTFPVSATLPETNIAHEHGWLEYYLSFESFEDGLVSAMLVSGRVWFLNFHFQDKNHQCFAILRSNCFDPC